MMQEGTMTIPGNQHETSGCQRVNSVLSRIGDKWSVQVIMRLSAGSLRFNELKREIGSVSQKMLSATLRGLERDGFVSRRVTPSVPPRVDYALTTLGHELLVPVGALGDWAFANIDTVEAARAAFDAAQGDSR